MTKKVFLIHCNGKSRNLRMGFCWMGFFLPIVWALSEGLWRPFAFSLLGYFIMQMSVDASAYYHQPGFSVAGIFSYPLAMLVFGLRGKRWILRDMLRNGYVDNSLKDMDMDAHARHSIQSLPRLEGK